MTFFLVVTHGAIGRSLYSMAINALLGGFSVTVHTPSHGKGFNLTHALHGIHGTMALLAGHTGRDMGTVVKGNILGQVMDTDP